MADKRVLTCLKALVFAVALYLGVHGAMILALRAAPPYYAIGSGSMEPTIETGSLVIVRGYGHQGQVEVGDVVAYESSGSIIVHRIVGRCEDGFRARGDANPVEDPWVIRFEDIRGEVMLSIPYLGYPIVIVRGVI